MEEMCQSVQNPSFTPRPIRGLLLEKGRARSGREDLTGGDHWLAPTMSLAKRARGKESGLDSNERTGYSLRNGQD
jgi:hypothetical protein